MRKEYWVAVLLFTASIPAGVAVSAAIEYFDLLSGHPGLALCVSAGFTGILVCAAIIVALRGEKKAEREGEQNRMLLVVGGSLICVGIICCIWYFVSSAKINPRQQEASAIAHLAELGWTVKPGNNDLQFDVAWKPLPPMDKSSTYFSQLRTPFHLFFQGVPNLSGLHLMSNIAGCYKIESNAGEFTDISELSGFTHLKTLVISQLPLNGNGVIDSTPLASLTSLKELILNSTRVRDSYFLTKLVHLKTLNLGGTLIGDISALQNAHDLSTLEIRDSRVADLSPLKNSNLSSLTIDGSQEAQVTEVGHVTSLMIIGSNIPNLAAVGKRADLETLMIWGGPVLDLGPLSSLKKLKSLQVSGLIQIGFNAPVFHADAIGNLTNLTSLTLGQLQLADIRFVRNLDQLQELNLSSMPVIAINAITNIKPLRKISLVQTMIVDITPLLSLPNLSELTVYRSPVRADILAQLEKSGIKINK